MEFCETSFVKKKKLDYFRYFSKRHSQRNEKGQSFVNKQVV